MAMRWPLGFNNSNTVFAVFVVMRNALMDVISVSVEIQ